MIINHYPPEKSALKIIEDLLILPKSPRSAIGNIPLIKNFFPKSHTEKGVYAIKEEDLKKWNQDKFAMNHFAKHKSNGKELVKLILEINEKESYEMLEGQILY